jgi:hypothetical protein
MRAQRREERSVTTTNQKRVVVPIRALAVFAVVGLVLAGCGGDDESGDATTTTARTARTTTTSRSTTAGGDGSTSTPASTTDIRVYLLRGEELGAARRTGPAATPARAAMEALLEGPNDADRSAGLTTAVPEGTRLLGLDIADGTATVDLSSEFASGGGSLSMQARVAEVVYTLTQFPTVQRVSFRVDGEAVDALGGEGLVLSEPQARSDWEALTPAILVEDPLPGDAVTSPFRVTGTANTFEATFIVTLIDAKGAKVYEQPAMATSGSGTRGTFDVTVAFTGAAPGAGTLRVWESSARDGSATNVVEIPVRL